MSRDTAKGLQSQMVFSMGILTAMRPSSECFLSMKHLKKIQLRNETVWKLMGVSGRMWHIQNLTRVVTELFHINHRRIVYSTTGTEGGISTFWRIANNTSTSDHSCRMRPTVSSYLLTMQRQIPNAFFVLNPSVGIRLPQS